ncbi:hypothetical protein OMP43_22635, partial [Sphingomonas sp. CBMAI 2297]|uniref:hypothetical protein n=1 Tax=Sphingomonas sp. CBMAI 2297 TaxID=2991720 RepID=UPI0024558C10
GSGASGAIGLGGFEGRLVGNTAGGLANAAARSLLGGTDFGDNILAALPDIIGQTIGEVIAGNWKPSAIERAFLNDAEASIARARAADSDLIPFPADAFTSGGVQLVDIPASSSYSLPSSIANESLNLAETPIATAGTLREVGTKNSSRISERDDYIDPYGAFEGALESPDGNSLVYFASRSGTSSQYKLDMAEAIGLEYGALNEDKAIRVGAHLRDLALKQFFLVEGRDYLRDASVTLAGMVEHLAYGKGWAKVLEVVNAAYIDVSAEVSRRDNQLYTETATLYAEAGRAAFSSVNLAMTAVDYSQGKASNADMFLAAIPFTRLGKLERFASAPRMSPIFKVPKIRASAAEGAGGAVIAGRTYRGGAYGRLSAQKGVIERHHAPADSVSPYTTYSGPAIQMDYADHLLTSSHGGQGLAGALYRSEAKRLIDSGNMRGAMAKEIWDIRRVSVQSSGSTTKYNAAMREMLDYAYGSGYLKKVP